MPQPGTQVAAEPAQVLRHIPVGCVLAVLFGIHAKPVFHALWRGGGGGVGSGPRVGEGPKGWSSVLLLLPLLRLLLLMPPAALPAAAAATREGLTSLHMSLKLHCPVRSHCR